MLRVALQSCANNSVGMHHNSIFGAMKNKQFLWDCAWPLATFIGRECRLLHIVHFPVLSPQVYLVQIIIIMNVWQCGSAPHQRKLWSDAPYVPFHNWQTQWSDTEAWPVTMLFTCLLWRNEDAGRRSQTPLNRGTAAEFDTGMDAEQKDSLQLPTINCNLTHYDYKICIIYE